LDSGTTEENKRLLLRAEAALDSQYTGFANRSNHILFGEDSNKVIFGWSTHSSMAGIKWTNGTVPEETLHRRVDCDMYTDSYSHQGSVVYIKLTIKQLAQFIIRVASYGKTHP
jgi:hypothetical protein